MKRKFFSLLTLSMVFFMVSCTNGNVTPGSNPPSPPDPEEPVAVTGISFDVDSLNLEVGDFYQLGITVSPSNAANKAFTIGSSKNRVVTVSKEGYVTAAGAGECEIIATTVDGSYQAICFVDVSDPVIETDIPVSSITISQTSLTLFEGETFTLSFTIEPTNATNKNVVWSSDNEEVATVNAGKITALKDGTCNITVRSVDGNYTSSCSLTVNKKQDDEEDLPTIDYVKVFADITEYNHIYAWVGSGSEVNKLCGEWPGSNLNQYDSEWLTYEFHDYTSFNLIFNDGAGYQTSDLSISAPGYYWCRNQRLYNKKPSEGAGDMPIGNFEVVDSAKDYTELPAVKNYNKGLVLDKYKGLRDDFRDETIYFAMTTRFYDGDSSNNRRCWDGRNNSSVDPEWRGDFKGLIEKMDYIKALGFTAIWITPVVKNASGYDYHGYHAINFSEVDPRYESEDVAFIDVIKEAHKRDMKIVLDVVFNHTCNYGEENLFPMFTYDPKNNATYSGLTPSTYYPLLPANYSSMNGTAQFNARLDFMKNSSDGYNIYHHEKNMDYEKYIEQTGSMAGDCIDLNTENPTVANYLVETYGEFIRMGVDAFRIDTMKHISRLTFNKYIWPGLYAIAEKCGNTGFYMFGEVCNRVRGVWNHDIAADSAPFYTWKENKEYEWGDRKTNEQSTLQNWNDNVSPTNQPSSDNAYLRDGYTYHTPDHSRSSGNGVIDFAMHWNFQHASDSYRVARDNDSAYNDATYNVVYVDSHDYGPDGIEKVRYNQGTDAWRENMSLMFTFRGVPCLYYGSEIEFKKGMTIDEGPNIALENSGRAYFGEHLQGEVKATDFGEYTASGTVKETLNYTLAQHVRQLNKIRLKVPALRRGQYTGGDNMSFVRRYTKGNIDSLAVVAISQGASFSNLPNGTYVDLISGKRVNVNGTLNIDISGQGSIAIYVLENSYTGTLTKIS